MLDSSFIDQNADSIVHAIGCESIDVYRFLSDRFRRSNVSSDTVFQFVFRSFYRLDNAGLTGTFKIRYFELLEANRGKESIDLTSIVAQLYELPNRKSHNTLQFSFATKLANTVNCSYPIYDSKVGLMFDFQVPANYKAFEVRLSEYMDLYADIQATYARIISNSDLLGARRTFRQVYAVDESQVPETKVIDFIVWQAGKDKEADQKVASNLDTKTKNFTNRTHNTSSPEFKNQVLQYAKSMEQRKAMQLAAEELGVPLPPSYLKYPGSHIYRWRQEGFSK
jgi:hypothetical protein